MTTPDYRDLISRMADELDYYRIGKEGYDTSHPLAAEARLALAEPVAPDAGEVADPVIPGEYRGFNAVAYRNGFHAGYKHALTRAALAAGLFENITGDENDG